MYLWLSYLLFRSGCSFFYDQGDLPLFREVWSEKCRAKAQKAEQQVALVGMGLELRTGSPGVDSGWSALS